MATQDGKLYEEGDQNREEKDIARGGECLMAMMFAVFDLC